MADFLITDSWYDKRKQEVEDEATRVVKQAAKLLISSMKDMDYTKDKYPLGKDVSDIDKCLTWLPDLVQTFLATLINNKLERAGIGQALVGATIPRSCLPPLLFAIDADIDSRLAKPAWLSIYFPVTHAACHPGSPSPEISVQRTNTCEL